MAATALLTISSTDIHHPWEANDACPSTIG
jgi:hypothetical protein